MDSKTSEVIIHGVDDPLLEITGWFIADDADDQAKYEARLQQAHRDVACMFINCKPFLFNPIKEVAPTRKGEIVPGVYLTPPSEMSELSSAILINTKVWQECFHEMNCVEVMDTITMLYGSSNAYLDIFEVWHEKHGFHIFEVV